MSVFVNSTGRQEWIKETTPRSSVHGAQCWARRPGSPISPPRPPRTPRESNWTPPALSPLICKIRQLSLQNRSQFKCYPWVHKALARLMKTALEIHWSFCPWARMLRRGAQKSLLLIPSKLNDTWKATACITNWDFFSMKDNAETGIVEKPGLVISYEKDVKYCLY